MSAAYTESDLLRQLRRQLASHSDAKPGPYQSQWQEALDQVVSQILSREEFSYDASADPLFRQYQDRYVTLGQRAMEDTLGRASALTGGYGNSHAQLAGQAAYNDQLQGLYDRMPELYSLALQRYQLQGALLGDRYDLLAGLEDTGYSRHKDSLEQWQQERSHLTGALDAERDFDYTAHRDAVKDDQWQQEFDEDLRRFNFKNKLGEFAPTPTSGSSRGGGSGKSVPKESLTKPEKKRTKTNAAIRGKQ